MACSDDGILKLGKAASQFLRQAPVLCKCPHEGQLISHVGYRRAIIHVIVHDDDVEALEAMEQETCYGYDVLTSLAVATTVWDRPMCHNFTIYGLCTHFADSALERADK